MSEQSKDAVLVLSKEESQMLQDVQAKGTGFIQSDAQIELLAKGMLKTGEATLGAVLDIVKKDAQLYDSIRKRTTDAVKEVIGSNNELTRKEIDNCMENSAAIRAFLISNPSEYDKCREDLRYYDRMIKEAQERNIRANETVNKHAQETDDNILAQSSKNKKIITTIAAAVGTGTALTGLALIVSHLIKKNG